MMAFFGRGFIDTQLGYRTGVIGRFGPANSVIKEGPDTLWIYLQYLGDPVDRHFPLDQG
jgi:hypothetical protein